MDENRYMVDNSYENFVHNMTQPRLVDTGIMPILYGTRVNHTKKQIIMFRKTWFYYNMNLRIAHTPNETSLRYVMGLHLIFKFLDFMYENQQNKQLFQQYMKQDVNEIAERFVAFVVGNNTDIHKIKIQLVTKDLKKILFTKLRDLEYND
jgi:UDP-galactopyranose mutase